MPRKSTAIIDDDSLEAVEAMLKWNWRKKPANPELRNEIAAELRASRAQAFQSHAGAARRLALARLRRFHKRSRLKMQPLIDAEITIRNINERKLAAFHLWLEDKYGRRP